MKRWRPTLRGIWRKRRKKVKTNANYTQSERKKIFVIIIINAMKNKEYQRGRCKRTDSEDSRMSHLSLFVIHTKKFPMENYRKFERQHGLHLHTHFLSHPTWLFYSLLLNSPSVYEKSKQTQCTKIKLVVGIVILYFHSFS